MRQVETGFEENFHILCCFSDHRFLFASIQFLYLMRNGGKVSGKLTKLVSQVKPSTVTLLGGSSETWQRAVELQPLTRTAVVICSAACSAEIYRALAAEGLYFNCCWM